MIDLAEIVAEMRRLGVTKYKSGDIEVELGELPEVTKVVDPREESRRRNEGAEAEKNRRMRTMFGATSVLPRIPQR